MNKKEFGSKKPSATSSTAYSKQAAINNVFFILLYINVRMTSYFKAIVLIMTNIYPLKIVLTKNTYSLAKHLSLSI